MKSKLVAILTNAFIMVTILAVSLVGYFSGSAVTATHESENLYYGSTGEGVSLMFNVYESTENVKKILDILDEHEAKATFFIGGCWADDNVDCVREICSRGHEIGSHGYFHKDHSSMSLNANLEEIRPSQRLLEMICLKKIDLFAPPSGAFNEHTLTACENLEMRVIMWSRDTVDWRNTDKGVVVNLATKDLKAGEFILMHPKDVTVTALPEILNYMAENGLKAVTVGENLGE